MKSSRDDDDDDNNTNGKNMALSRREGCEKTLASDGGGGGETYNNSSVYHSIYRCPPIAIAICFSRCRRILIKRFAASSCESLVVVALATTTETRGAPARRRFRRLHQVYAFRAQSVTGIPTRVTGRKILLGKAREPTHAHTRFV